MRVTCPFCNGEFEVPTSSQRKGDGAHYADRILKLSPMHIKIIDAMRHLNATSEDRATPKRAIGGMLANMGYKVSGNVISGRLSELLGLGKVVMLRKRIQLYDRDRQTYRFKRTPVWYLESQRVLDETPSALHTES